MSFGKILFKTTGLMTERFRLVKCAKLGEYLTKNAVATGVKTTAEDVSLFLHNNLNARTMSRITVSSDAKVFENFLINEMGVDANIAQYIASNSLSSASMGLRGNALLDLRITDMAAPQRINISVHETQHLLYRISGIRTKFEMLLGKIMGRKYCQKYLEKYASIMNEKNMSIQNNLLGSLGFNHASEGFAGGEALEVILGKTGCKNIAELHKSIQKLIREDILLPNCDKRNARLLKSIAVLLRDEANSYRIGGLAEKNYNKAAEIAFSGDTKAETLATLYEEAIPVLKSEMRMQRRNNIRRFFGLKPQEYAMTKEPTIKCTLSDGKEVKFSRITNADGEKVLNTSIGNADEICLTKQDLLAAVEQGELTQGQVKELLDLLET